MYAEWPMFRALIDNAELALAKADMEAQNAYQQWVTRQNTALAEKEKEKQTLEAEFAQLQAQHETLARSLAPVVEAYNQLAADLNEGRLEDEGTR